VKSTLYQDLLDRVEVRKEEERRRPEAVDEVRRLIALARKAAQNVTKLVKDDDPNPWYTTEDVTKVRAVLPPVVWAETPGAERECKVCLLVGRAAQFTESVNATEEWLTAGVAAQEGKAAHEEAAITVRELERRARQLEKEILALLKKPKPKPAKKAETAAPKDKASEDKATEGKASEEDKAADENAKSNTDQGTEGGAENANADDATAAGAEGEEPATESAEGAPADEHAESDQSADAAPEAKDEL